MMKLMRLNVISLVIVSALCAVPLAASADDIPDPPAPADGEAPSRPDYSLTQEAAPEIVREINEAESDLAASKMVREKRLEEIRQQLKEHEKAKRGEGGTPLTQEALGELTHEMNSEIERAAEQVERVKKAHDSLRERDAGEFMLDLFGWEQKMNRDFLFHLEYEPPSREREHAEEDIVPDWPKGVPIPAPEPRDEKPKEAPRSEPAAVPVEEPEPEKPDDGIEEVILGSDFEHFDALRSGSGVLSGLNAPVARDLVPTAVMAPGPAGSGDSHTSGEHSYDKS